MSPVIFQTELPYPKRSGKVRDVYDISALLPDSLLIVAIDRISAFDCIMPTGIPDKGAILTQISNHWFTTFAAQFQHHLIETSFLRFPQPLLRFKEQIAGRSVIARKAEVVPIECVARGYLAGSGWKEYRRTRTVCGVRLPEGLRQCDKLPEPIFTPATKAESGHDENVSFDVVAGRFGIELAGELRQRTLALYVSASEQAARRGIIIADTKFEFGRTPEGRLILIDEILTPDSSRFWPADAYEPGEDQPSFDKQYLRNWLEAQPWDKTPPAPPLPPEIVVATRLRYTQAYEKLLGKRWTSAAI